ncbi:MAG: hypothetical protein R2705_19325 [Ilumatobacteraceae bacterium]
MSDASSLAGLPPGAYDVDGAPVTVRDGSVRLPDGTLAGSAVGLDVGVRRLVSWGVPLAAAIDAAGVPARAIGATGLGRPRGRRSRRCRRARRRLRGVENLVDGREVFARS